MASSAEHFIELVEGVSAVEGVAGIELNVSCPNVHSGLIVGEQPDETLALMDKLRPRTSLPLIVKLTPNVTSILLPAMAAKRGGADVVSLINNFRDPAAGNAVRDGLGAALARRGFDSLAAAQTSTLS